MENPAAIPRKLWEHPDPKSTLMWEFMQDINRKSGQRLEVRDIAVTCCPCSVLCQLNLSWMRDRESSLGDDTWASVSLLGSAPVSSSELIDTMAVAPLPSRTTSTTLVYKNGSAQY